MKALAMVGMLACLASLPAFADCVEPQATFHLPDGAVATREDMVSAKNALTAYDSAVKGYVDCVQRGDGNAIRAAPVLQKLTAIADRFNAELRAFRKRNDA